MPRDVKPRGPDEWPVEVSRLRRIARAARIDGEYDDEWKAFVLGCTDALILVLSVSPEGANSALVEAHRRLATLRSGKRGKRSQPA